jgi:hypothetical protein
VETVNHLFLGCIFFGFIWHLVRHWLGAYSADPSRIMDHFLRLDNLPGYTKSKCSFMLLIWFVTSWVIWKERNDRIFHGKENTPIHLLEKIKLLFFWWFKANFVVFPYQFYTWCQNPFLCLDIGN